MKEQGQKMRKLIMLLAAGVAFGALADTQKVGGYTWTIEGTVSGLCIESDGGSIRVMN